MERSWVFERFQQCACNPKVITLCLRRKNRNGIGLESKARIVRHFLVQPDGNAERAGEKCRGVRRMLRPRLCVPNGELEQRFVTLHLTMGTTGWKSWLPQKIQKLLLQGCIKSHWTTNKGVNVGEKKNYKRKPITVRWIIFFKSASFFPNYS